MLPTEVSTEIKPIDAKTIPGTATAHFRDEKKPLNHRIRHNEDPTAGACGRRRRCEQMVVSCICWWNVGFAKRQRVVSDE